MNPDLRLAPAGTIRDEYAAFVRERHRIWELRSMGIAAPWTDSPILDRVKFTNDYRILDTGSQYSLRMLQDAVTPEDVVLRAMAYRLTNRPELWDLYRAEVGRWPILPDVLDGTLERVVRRAAAAGVPMFSSAYILSPGGAGKGVSRPEWLIQMLGGSFAPGGVHPLDAAIFSPETTLGARVDYLRTVPRIADFLAMQIATDIGYSDLLPSDEDAFVVVGPGSRRGLRALDLAPTAESIRTLHAEIRSTVSLDVRGTPRPLSLMDVQNTLCEFGKYHGFLTESGNRMRRFTPTGRLSAVHTDPIYPNHWS